MTRRLATGALLPVLLTTLLGCHSSGVEGPQVTKVPPGFGYDPNARTSRRVFPDRDVLRERGWGTVHGGDRHSHVSVVEHEGAAGHGEIRAARDALAERWGSEHYRYGEPRGLRIDGRDALAWYERQASSRACTAVVPHDDATFVVRFYSSEPSWQDDARLLEVVSSFERDPRSVERLAVPVLAVVLAGGLGFATWRMRSGR